MNSESDRIDQLRKRSSRIADDRSSLTAYTRLDVVGDDLDDTLNFKINSGLKSEFAKLCKQNESNISRELKLYMRAAITAGKLI